MTGRFIYQEHMYMDLQTLEDMLDISSFERLISEFDPIHKDIDPPELDAETVLESCTICAEEFPLDPNIERCLRHDSKTCSDCMRKNVSTQIKNRKRNISCTSNGCQYTYSPSQISSLFGANWDSLQQKMSEYLYTMDKSFVFCPSNGCDAVFFIDPNDRPTCFSCDTCESDFCMTCKEKSHPGKSCDLIADIEYLKTTKRCPSCDKRIEKNKGCMHMTCTMCRYEFCWKCSNRWHGGTPCQKPVKPKIGKKRMRDDNGRFTHGEVEDIIASATRVTGNAYISTQKRSKRKSKAERNTTLKKVKKDIAPVVLFKDEAERIEYYTERAAKWKDLMTKWTDAGQKDITAKIE